MHIRYVQFDIKSNRNGIERQLTNDSQRNSGYGHSNTATSGWKSPTATGAAVGSGAAITANKNWQTSSGNPNYGGTQNGLNYPRQQYHPNTQTSYSNNQYHTPSQQPTVINNIITNNNHHSNYHTPGVTYSYRMYIFIFNYPNSIANTNNNGNISFSARVGYHFVSYDHYPSYYSPFHDYRPLGFTSGLILGSALSHHHDHGYGYHDHHHYHNHNTYSSSTSTTTGNNGVTTTNTVTTSGTSPNIINNFNNPNPNNANNANNPNPNLIQNNNSNNGPNGQNNQSYTDESLYKQASSQPMQPYVDSISGQSKTDDVDSTEIIFTNPYLIVGVENLLFYGEFHDDEDIKIVIDQGSDGLESKFVGNWYSQQPVETNRNSTNAANQESSPADIATSSTQDLATESSSSTSSSSSTTTTESTGSINTEALSSSTDIPLAQFPEK